MTIQAPGQRFLHGVMSVMACCLVAQIAAAAEVAHAPDRIIVKFRDQQSSSVMQDLRSSVGAEVVRSFRGDGALQLWKLGGGASLERAIAEIRTNPAVAYAEPDFIVTVNQATVPNDPEYVSGSQWNMDNQGQNGGLVGADISAVAGWTIRHRARFADNSRVVVAVIDTGIRRTHEDLAANMWSNSGDIPDNGLDDDNNGYIDDTWGLNAITWEYIVPMAGNPDDDHGHGTHVAGIIGAVGNNAKGVAGVAWDVALMNVKFIASNGSGWVSDAVEGIDYARQNGAHIINASWGGGGYSQALEDAITRAGDAGIIFVAAAGNWSADNDGGPNYPASYRCPNLVAVASSDYLDSLSYFSNFGKLTVDLAAPGDRILSAHNANDSAYAMMDGTSMAAPHVSGAMALLRAHRPDDSLQAQINRLLNSTRRVGALDPRIASSGILDLGAALQTSAIQPINDEREKAAPIRVNTLVRGNNEGAGKTQGESAHRGHAGGASVWYRLIPHDSGINQIEVTPRGDWEPIVAVYGVSTNGLFEVVDAAEDSDPAKASVLLQAGRAYYVVVDGVGAGTGDFSFAIKQPPPNDMSVNATRITGHEGQWYQEANGASTEPGEYNLAPMQATIWFVWTAPATGNYIFGSTAENPTGPRAIAYYKGTNLSNLQPLTHQQTSGSYLWSSTGLTMESSFDRLSVVEGETYYIQYGLIFDGVGLGRFRLGWYPAAVGDVFYEPAQLEGVSGSFFGDARGASWDYVRPPYHGNGYQDIWFKWTAPRDGTTYFSTVGGANWDTTLEVFSGDTPETLQLISANDDYQNQRQSRVDFIAEKGQTYRVRLNVYTTLGIVSVFDNRAGPYTLRWQTLGDQAGDMDNDGFADILVRQSGTGQHGARLMLGVDSIGTVNLAWVPADAIVVGVADFNSDGLSDVLIRNPSVPTTYRIGVRGQTVAWTDVSPLAGKIVRGVGDFNEDGFVDIVTEDSAEMVGIQLMEGLTAKALVSLGTLPPGWRIVAVGDFNGDGNCDLIKEEQSSGQREIIPMLGMTMLPTRTLGAPDALHRIVGSGDYDSDGCADLVVENQQTGAVEIWLVYAGAIARRVPLTLDGTGWALAGSIRSPPSFVVAPSSRSVARGQGVIFRAQVTGSPTPSLQWMKNGKAVVGETGPILAIDRVNDSDAGQYVLVASGSNGVTSSAPATLLVRYSYDPDFNEDGKPDVLLENRETGQRVLWLMNGVHVSSATDLGVLSSDWRIVATADFTADGDSDLLLENAVSGQRVLWIMNGTSVAAGVGLGSLPPDWHIVLAADFDRDGQPDILLENTSSGQRVVWLMDGVNVTAGVDMGSLNPSWRISAGADFNADGRVDILLENISSGQRVIWLMSGTHVQAGVNLGSLDPVWRISKLADFDADHDPDILLENSATGQRVVWVMDRFQVVSGIGLGSLDPAWKILK